jgi:hypothetical protein
MPIARRFRERSFSPVYKPSGIPILGKLKQYQNGSLAWEQYVSMTGTPKASLEYERTWDQKNPGPPYISGGPFAKVYVRLDNGEKYHGIYSNFGKPGITWDNRLEYVGGFGNPNIENDGITYQQLAEAGYYAPFNTTVIPSLAGLGSAAYMKMRPKLENMSLAVSLAELRELPRMLKTTAKGFMDLYHIAGGRDGKRSMYPKKVADQFLNQQFGWAPFISDIMKFYHIYRNQLSLMNQKVDKNGKWYQKHRVLEASGSTQLLFRGYSPGLEPTLLDLCRVVDLDGNFVRGSHDIHAHLEKKIWATGWFTYYRPEFDKNLVGFDSNWNHVNRLLTIYGARVSPSMLYAITPWSWLVDWFTNLGDVIQRASDWALDAIVTKDFYLMYRQIKRIRGSHTLYMHSGDHTFYWDRVIETKQRQVADPYGFELSWDSLSTRQLAILAALGISRT